LCKIDYPSKVAHLVKLLDDKDSWIAVTAIRGLHNAPLELVAAPLARRLRDSSHTVRHAAANALQSRNWKPPNAEEEVWFAAALGDYHRACARGHAALRPLQLVLSTGPYDQRVKAVEALGTIDHREAPAILIAALNSDDPNVCTFAIHALSRWESQDINSAFLRVLKHPNGNVRAAAAEALGRVRATGAAEALLALIGDPIWDVRRAAIEALTRMRNSAAADQVAAALMDPDADVREAAARALGHFQERLAIGPLVVALCDADTSVRRIAAAALSRIQEDWSRSPEAYAATAAVRTLLNDPLQETRRRAGDILASLEAARELGAGPSHEQSNLARSIFAGLLRDGDPYMRCAAVEALAALAGPDAPEMLKGVLSDPLEIVRETAAECLKGLPKNHDATPSAFP